MKRLNEVINLWLTNGIFSALEKLDVPWKNEVQARGLNFEYHGNISGEKIISPLVYKLTQGLPITQETLDILAQGIYDLFDSNWKKMWATLSFEYNPIENYRMVEEGNDDVSNTYNRTQNDTRDNTITTDGNNTVKDGGTVDIANTGTVDNSSTTTGTTSNTESFGINGFNKDTSSPYQDNSGSNNINTIVTNKQTNNLGSKETRDLTSTNTSKQTTTDNLTGKITIADTGTNTTEHTLTRSGNIGVTTSQQMIESERDLWKYYYFHNTIFPDIDKVLTIKIY